MKTSVLILLYYCYSVRHVPRLIALFCFDFRVLITLSGLFRDNDWLTDFTFLYLVRPSWPDIFVQLATYLFQLKQRMWLCNTLHWYFSELSNIIPESYQHRNCNLIKMSRLYLKGLADSLVSTGHGECVEKVAVNYCSQQTFCTIKTSCKCNSLKHPPHHTQSIDFTKLQKRLLLMLRVL